MKTFLIILSEKEPGTLTKDLLVSHVNFLKKLSHEGILKICGPFMDNEGAVLIINAHSTEQAESIVTQDPFLKARYYKSFKIQEFLVANEGNNWLCDAPQTKNNLV